MDRKAINGLVVLVGVGFGLALSIGPWRTFAEQRSRTERLVQERKRSEAARSEVVRKEARYSTPVGKEANARDYGWKMAGEELADKASK